MLLDWRRHVAVNWMEEYRVISRRPRGYVDWLRATLIWRTDTVNRNPCSSLPQTPPPPLPTWSILILVSRFLLPLSFVWSLFAYFWRAKSCGTNFALWLYYCVNNGSQRAVRGGHRDRSWCLGESLICQLSLNELALAALSSSCMHNKWHSRVLSCRLKARGSSCYLIRRGLLMKGLSFLPLWNLFAAVELVQQTESSILQHKKKCQGTQFVSCFLFPFIWWLCILSPIVEFDLCRWDWLIWELWRLVSQETGLACFLSSVAFQQTHMLATFFLSFSIAMTFQSDSDGEKFWNWSFGFFFVLPRPVEFHSWLTTLDLVGETNLLE